VCGWALDHLSALQVPTQARQVPSETP
jgi:hypothetical protein